MRRGEFFSSKLTSKLRFITICNIVIINNINYVTIFIKGRDTTMVFCTQVIPYVHNKRKKILFLNVVLEKKNTNMK